MSKAVIAIDDWKLPIFNKHLNRANIPFTLETDVIKHVIFITVHTDNLLTLGRVVQAANAEADKMKSTH